MVQLATLFVDYGVSMRSQFTAFNVAELLGMWATAVHSPKLPAGRYTVQIIQSFIQVAAPCTEWCEGMGKEHGPVCHAFVKSLAITKARRTHCCSHPCLT